MQKKVFLILLVTLAISSFLGYTVALGPVLGTIAWVLTIRALYVYTKNTTICD